MQISGKARYLSPALVFYLAIIGASSMLVYHLGFFIPRMLAVRALNGGGNGYSFGDDFYPIWLTARQSRPERFDLYATETTREIQKGLFGRPLDAHNLKDPPTDYREFAYPAFTDLLLWPASLPGFPVLRIFLAIVLPVLTILSIQFWIVALQWRVDTVRFATIVILAMCSYELLEAFFAEQPGLLVGFFLAASALALRRGRLLLAGILLSLSLIKPQVTLVATLYLLLWSFADRKRAQLWMGFSFITVSLAAASFLVWPHWLREWIEILLGYHRYALPPLVTVLLGPGLGARLGPIFIAALFLISARIAWQNRCASVESKAFWLTLSLLLVVTSLALLPGQAIYDHIILIPGILILLRDRHQLRDAGRVPRALLTVGALVLFWQWIAAFALLCIRFFSLSAFNSYMIFSLPIRTAASLPFAVLALLVWTWRLSVTSQATS